MEAFATIEDVEILFRNLTEEEKSKAPKLLEVASDMIRIKANNVGRDFDQMIMDNKALVSVAKSVVVEMVGRKLRSSTASQPLSQYSQSALGYTASGSFLNPGQGMYLLNNEMKALGLNIQRIKRIDLC